MNQRSIPPRNTFSMRTGVAHIRSLPASVIVKLSNGELDRKILAGPLVHEIVHHACANTAVSIALQYRWLELLRHSLSSPALGMLMSERELDLASDLAAAEAILQPISEGIAHFAEFDCLMISSRELQTSATGCADGVWWSLLGLKAPSATLDELSELCREELLDPRTIDRKVEVLCHPLFPSTGSDAYLVGYLFVKSLWDRFLKGGVIPCLRSPAFLEFVTYYFFEDWELARILTAPGRISTPDVLARIAARCRQLVETDLQESAQAFIADKRSRAANGVLLRGLTERDNGPFAGLNLSVDEVEAGMSQMVGFLHSKLLPNAPLPTGFPRVANSYNLLHSFLLSHAPSSDPEVVELKRRNLVPVDVDVRFLDVLLEIPRRKSAFCHLFDIPVEIRSQGRHTLTFAPSSGNAFSDASNIGVVSDAPVAAQISTPIQGRLHVAMVSTDFPWRLYCLLLSRNQVLACWGNSNEPLSVEEAKRFAESICYEAIFEEAYDFSFEWLNTYITANAFVGDQVSAAADEATASVIASLRGLINSAAGLFKHRPLHDFGLRSFLSKRDLRSLAVAGLAASGSSDRETIVRSIESTGATFSEILSISDKFAAAHGFEWVRASPEHVIVCL